MESVDTLTEREKIVLKFIYENRNNPDEYRTYFRNTSQYDILHDMELRGFAFDVIRDENDEIITADVSKEVKEYFEKK